MEEYQMNFNDQDSEFLEDMSIGTQFRYKDETLNVLISFKICRTFNFQVTMISSCQTKVD